MRPTAPRRAAVQHTGCRLPHRHPANQPARRLQHPGTLSPASGGPPAPRSFRTSPGEVPMAPQRTVLKDGCVLSIDRKVGNFRQADVLIEGTKIAAVGPHLSAADAEVID